MSLSKRHFGSDRVPDRVCNYFKKDFASVLNLFKMPKIHSFGHINLSKCGQTASKSSIQYKPPIVPLSGLSGNDFPMDSPTTVARSSTRISNHCFSIVPHYINSVECVVRIVYNGVTIQCISIKCLSQRNFRMSTINTKYFINLSKTFRQLSNELNFRKNEHRRSFNIML